MRERRLRLAAAIAALLVTVAAAAPLAAPKKRTPPADPREVAALARQLTNELVEAVAEAAGNPTERATPEEGTASSVQEAKGKETGCSDAVTTSMEGRTLETTEGSTVSGNDKTLESLLSQESTRDLGSTEFIQTGKYKGMDHNTLITVKTPLDDREENYKKQIKGVSERDENVLSSNYALGSVTSPRTPLELSDSEVSLRTDNSLGKGSVSESESTLTNQKPVENNMLQTNDNVLETYEVTFSSEPVRQVTSSGSENLLQTVEAAGSETRGVNSEALKKNNALGSGIHLSNSKDLGTENTIGSDKFPKKHKLLYKGVGKREETIHNSMELQELGNNKARKNSQLLDAENKNSYKSLKSNKGLAHNTIVRDEKLLAKEMALHNDDSQNNDVALSVTSTLMSYMSPVTNKYTNREMTFRRKEGVTSDSLHNIFKDQQSEETSGKNSPIANAFFKNDNRLNVKERAISENNLRNKVLESTNFGGSNKGRNKNKCMVRAEVTENDKALVNEKASLNDKKIPSDVKLVNENTLLSENAIQRRTANMAGKSNDKVSAIAKENNSEEQMNIDRVAFLKCGRKISRCNNTSTSDKSRGNDSTLSSDSWPSSTHISNDLTMCFNPQGEEKPCRTTCKCSTCSSTTKCTKTKSTCTTTCTTTTCATTTTSTCSTTTTCRPQCSTFNPMSTYRPKSTGETKLFAQIFLTSSQLTKSAHQEVTTPVWEGDESDLEDSGEDGKRKSEKRVRRQDGADYTEQLGRQLALVLWRAAQARRNSAESPERDSLVGEESSEELDDTHLKQRRAIHSVAPRPTKRTTAKAKDDPFTSVVPIVPVNPIVPVGTVGTAAPGSLFPGAPGADAGDVVATPSPIAAVHADEWQEASSSTEAASRRTHAKHPLKTPRGRPANAASARGRVVPAAQSDEGDSISMKSGARDISGSRKGAAGDASKGKASHGSERPWLIDADGDHIMLVPSDPPSGKPPSADDQLSATTQWHETLLSRLQKLEQVLNKERAETLKEDAELEMEEARKKKEKENERVVLIGEGVKKNRLVSPSVETETIKDEDKLKTRLYDTSTTGSDTTLKASSWISKGHRKAKIKSDTSEIDPKINPEINLKEFGEPKNVDIEFKESTQSSKTNSAPSSGSCEYRLGAATKKSSDSRVIMGKIGSNSNATFVQRTVLETAVGPGPDGRLTANSVIIVRNTFLQPRPSDKDATRKGEPKVKPMCVAKGRLAEMLPVTEESDSSSSSESGGVINLGAQGSLRGRPQVKNNGASGMQLPKAPTSGRDSGAPEDEDDVVRRRPVGVASRGKGHLSDSLAKLNDRGDAIDLGVPGSRRSQPEVNANGAVGTLRVFQKIREKQKQDVASDEDASTPDKILQGVNDPRPSKCPVSKVVRPKGNRNHARVQMATPETGVMYGGDAGPEVVVTDVPSSVVSPSDGALSKEADDTTEREVGRNMPRVTIPAQPSEERGAGKGISPEWQRGSDTTKYFQNLDPTDRQESATSSSGAPWSIQSSLSSWQSSPRHHKRPHLPPSLLILPDDRLQMAEGVPHVRVVPSARRRYDAAEEAKR